MRAVIERPHSLGTGEPNFGYDAYGGAGLLKSTDGGRTWQIQAAATFAQDGFSDIKVDPTHANTVLAATTQAQLALGSTSAPQGIFRSTDGGTTWAQTLNGTATQLDVDPTNFLRQYAGLGDIFGNPSNGVYRSVNGGRRGRPSPGHGQA